MIAVILLGARVFRGRLGLNRLNNNADCAPTAESAGDRQLSIYLQERSPSAVDCFEIRMRDGFRIDDVP